MKVSIQEAEESFFELVAAVEMGEEVYITIDGEPVVKMVKVERKKRSPSVPMENSYKQ